MKKELLLACTIVLVLSGAVPERASAARFLRLADHNGGGLYVNLIAREIRVTPIRAHVGDVIRIDAVVEHQGEGRGTIRGRVTANGREVSSMLYSYGGEADRLQKIPFEWDTKREKPGSYRVGVEFSLWEDGSPSDNALDAPEMLVLLPPDSTEATGGSSAARDPRYHPR